MKNPHASVDLLLRFTTSRGARTLLVRGIEAQDASEIAGLMECAGHHASYVDARGGKPMAKHMADGKRKARQAAMSNVVTFKSISTGANNGTNKIGELKT